MYKKALVTGGAGFIGLNIVKKLSDEGYTVHILDNFQRGVKDKMLQEVLEEKNVELLDKNALDKNELSSLDTDYNIIFHFAAILGVQKVLNEPYKVLAENTEMLINLIELGNRQKKLDRFVFTSTSEVYAGTLKYHGLDFPTHEDTPLTVSKIDHPRTSYMLSKIYGEAICVHSKLPFTIIRPHNIYGPRMGLSHVVPELLNKAHNLKDGSQLEVYSIDHQRTFCYISDAVELIYKASILSNGKNQIFNVGVESPELNIGQLAKTIIETVGKKLEILPKEPTPGSPTRRCPSIKNIVDVTGYHPRVSLAEGVMKTYKWYKANVFEGKEVSAK